MYDTQVCLKMNWVMWFMLFFLIRPYIVLALSIANSSDRTFLVDLVYPDYSMMLLGALAGIPAALVIYAWTRKKPGVSGFVEKIWRNGRSLLATSAVLNAGVIVASPLLIPAHVIPFRDWAQLAASVLIVLVLWKSTYIRDCFNDFPEHQK